MFFEDFSIIDLTHPLSSQVPTWNGSCGFHLEVKLDYDQTFRVQQIKMHAGIGTHIDAPSHRIQGGSAIDDLPLQQLIAPACVIDVSTKAHEDYEISLEDIEHYEKQFGLVPEHSLVIGYTGWSRYWQSPDQYRNEDANGQMHFPVFSKEAAELLLQRNVVGIAIDTLSPDCLDHSFPVHKIILGAEKYIIENIADCSLLPPKGAMVIALPIRAQNATEAPIRIVGLVKKSAAH